jgi:cation diffusion facilitator CzcD-associated flavoprotein CzcO
MSEILVAGAGESAIEITAELLASNQAIQTRQ